MGFGKGVRGFGKVIKYLLFLINILIFVGGFVVLSIGIWTLFDKRKFAELIGSQMFSHSAILLTITGSLVVVSSFFGCVGAIKEIKCMLLTYFIILLVLFLFMLLAAVLGYVYRDKIESKSESRMNSTRDKYNTNNVLQEAWDTAQSRLKCCGVKTASEWGTNVPKSCCAGAPDKCNAANAYSTGCHDKIKTYVKEHVKVIAGVAIGIASVLVLGMICSIALYRMIR